MVPSRTSSSVPLHVTRSLWLTSLPASSSISSVSPRTPISPKCDLRQPKVSNANSGKSRDDVRNRPSVLALRLERDDQPVRGRYALARELPCPLLYGGVSTRLIGRLTADLSFCGAPSRYLSESRPDHPIGVTSCQMIPRKTGLKLL